MSVSDFVADSLTKIRNAQRAGHEHVELHMSNMIEAILTILKEEGFIETFYPYSENTKQMAKVELRYHKGSPVIRGIERVSKPGRRVYVKWEDIRPTLNNIGLGIISTPKGVISGKTAKYLHVGGEFICKVW